jgi:hypothetical protein
VVDLSLADGITLIAPKVTVNSTGDIDLNAYGDINISASGQVRIASEGDNAEIDDGVYLQHEHTDVTSGSWNTGSVAP